MQSSAIANRFLLSIHFVDQLDLILLLAHITRQLFAYQRVAIVMIGWKKSLISRTTNPVDPRSLPSSKGNRTIKSGLASSWSRDNQFAIDDAIDPIADAFAEGIRYLTG